MRYINLRFTYFTYLLTPVMVLTANRWSQSTDVTCTRQTTEGQPGVDTHLAHLDNSRCQCHCSVAEQSRRPCTAEACQHIHTSQ